jgi:hypothetical protein
MTTSEILLTSGCLPLAASSQQTIKINIKKAFSVSLNLAIRFLYWFPIHILLQAALNVCQNEIENQFCTVYIAGYVVRMVTRQNCCPLCLAALIRSKEEAEKRPSHAANSRNQ